MLSNCLNLTMLYKTAPGRLLQVMFIFRRTDPTSNTRVYIRKLVLYFRGNVVTMECVEKIIKRDMIDPTNGKKLTDKDIIPIQRVRTN